MELDIQVGERTACVELISKEGNKVQIAIDGVNYEVDIVMVENGVYSIISDNKSYNVELTRGESGKHYMVNTLYNFFPVEIVDIQSKYMKSRKVDDSDENQTRIFSPMHGKIVKIPVKVGDEAKLGQTVIIVEAMKMQSEYKVKRDCIIKEILVSEGDNIEGKQTLIVIE
ncbi:MAG: acetyl-CoA carboxylase biotin carboxyl carrier protein subunit [Bacteroidetes bacterium]|nr:acetyl-CoA carboxylase biotin carboxyl carrier protein subunit [Bacteroidota bacterium]